MRRPFSIGVFTYSTLPRGSVVHAAALAEALTDLGLDATLYALDKSEVGFYRPVRCRLVLVPAADLAANGQTAGSSKGVRDSVVRVRISELREYLKLHRPVHDVYHAQDCLTASALLDFSQAKGRMFRTVHHVERFENLYLRVCQERSIRESNGLCAVSRHTGREVARYFNCDAPVVGNGVALNRTSTVDAASVVAERQALLAGGDGPLLLSFGGVEWRKNTLGILQAFGSIKLRYPQAVWAIAGGATVLDHGAYSQQFEAALTATEHAQDVLQLGVVSEARVGSLLSAADVVVCPSLQEGFGLTALEAAAAGVPCVVSKAAPFNEYLDSSSAFWAEPLDPPSIGAAIESALTCPWARQLAARQVAGNHAWRKVAQRCVALYSRSIALDRGPKPESIRA